MNTSRRLVVFGCLMVLAFAAAAAQIAPRTATGASGGRGGGRGPGLTLTSPSFPDGGILPPRFTALDPDPVSPGLVWTNVPATTAAFVLIAHDPDTARQGKIEDVLHWMVINIPNSARELQEGIPNIPQLADGSMQPRPLSNGTAPTVSYGYTGPGAPAAGPYHHYTFELFALDAKLDLTPEATRAEVLNAMDGHIVGKAVMVARFHR